MQIATGKVISGKVIVEGLTLNEGEVVTVLTHENEPAVQLSAEDEAELLESIEEADSGRVISAEELFSRLSRAA